MSRLLGPPSETINSVSERASALAGDQIAGAGTMAPAATPETDFRKSRRFMGCSNARGKRLWSKHSQGSCQILTEARGWFKAMIRLSKTEFFAPSAVKADCIQRNSFAYYEGKSHGRFFVGRPGIARAATGPGSPARTGATADFPARPRNQGRPARISCR